MSICECKGNDLEVAVDHEKNANKLHGPECVECRRKSHRDMISSEERWVL